ncbi:MAG: hypothetical protein ACOC37_01825 [Spirochaetota bacterium]
MAASTEKTKRALAVDFVELARSVFGEALESVTVYGSFLKATFTPGTSDVNVLVIVGEGHERALRELGRRGKRLLRSHRITPLVLTRREFVTSADVFPMEYLDIMDTHEVLHGPDVTTELEISRSNLRHETEHQLRGSLVTLRQLAVAAGRPRPFRKLLLRRRLEEWYGSLAAILRGLLRLHGVTVVPQASDELVREINRVLGLEPGPILELLACRQGECPDSVELIDGLLERLARLVEIVDAGPSGGGDAAKGSS